MCFLKFELNKEVKSRYIDFVKNTFDFPKEEFAIEQNELLFHGVSLMKIIEKYGTPLKITYLPKIHKQITQARKWFHDAIKSNNYQGKYFYSFSTKSSHFSFVIEQVLKANAHIEISSAFDINIIKHLYNKGLFDKRNFILCNGFKQEEYIKNIQWLLNHNFVNTIPILDNLSEIELYRNQITNKPLNIGIRVATKESEKKSFHTSRLGICYDDILPFVNKEIKYLKNFKLKMLHFFIGTGVKDTEDYWSELIENIHLYCKLKKTNPDLQYLNIGGGLPIRNVLFHNCNYPNVINKTVKQIKTICKSYNIPDPDIFTEYGNYTVGESMINIYTVINQKKQNNQELWNIINGSLLTTLPDIWATKQRYILLPVNQWDKPYERIFLGGLTCDNEDYYDKEGHSNTIFLPQFNDKEKLHIAFLYTGAYQEALSGYGGIKHCLIPSPKHILVDKNKQGKIITQLFAKEQSYHSMLKILGF